MFPREQFEQKLEDTQLRAVVRCGPAHDAEQNPCDGLFIETFLAYQGREPLSDPPCLVLTREQAVWLRDYITRTVGE